MPARVTEVKCRRCRKVLFTEECTPVMTAHGEIRHSEPRTRCNAGVTPEYCLYITTENMPDWINTIVTKEHWIKGRIHCPECKSRLGSFNFISDMTCDCGAVVPPPIRIIHCKVDRLYDQNNQPSVPHVARAFRVPERQHPAPALQIINQMVNGSHNEN